MAIKLRAVKETLNSYGKIAYNEGNCSSSIIRLKKEVLNEFPDLRKKGMHFRYNLMLCRSFDELEKYITKLKKEKEAIPFILFIEKEDEAK